MDHTVISLPAKCVSRAWCLLVNKQTCSLLLISPFPSLSSFVSGTHCGTDLILWTFSPPDFLIGSHYNLNLHSKFNKTCSNTSERQLFDRTCSCPELPVRDKSGIWVKRVSKGVFSKGWLSDRVNPCCIPSLWYYSWMFFTPIPHPLHLYHNYFHYHPALPLAFTRPPSLACQVSSLSRLLLMDSSSHHSSTAEEWGKQSVDTVHPLCQYLDLKLQHKTLPNDRIVLYAQ